LLKKRRSPKIFPGWWTVIAGGIIALWAHGFHTYGFSALFKPISSELRFNRAVTSGAASIMNLEGSIESPLIGWTTDRFGPRYLILIGVALMSLSLILMNWINSLWAYYVVWGVMLGTGAQMGLFLPIDVAISNWFVKKRGRALSIKWTLSGLSGMLILPLVAWLITTQGWRTTCLIGGIVLAIIGLPLAWFFIKQRRPEYYGLLPDGATVSEDTVDTDQMIDRGIEYAAEMQEVEFTLRQALKTRTYWLLLIIGAIPDLAYPVMGIHLIPFLTDRGMNLVAAAGMMAIMVTAGIPARFIGGFIADRVRRDHLRYLLGAIPLVQALGLVLFLFNQTTSMIYVWFILWGIGFGANLTIGTTVTVRYFGRKALGSIEGSYGLFFLPIGVIAPIYVGWLYDTTGSYMIAFIVLAISMTVTGVLFPFIKPPKPPAQVSDVRQIV